MRTKWNLCLALSTLLVLSANPTMAQSTATNRCAVLESQIDDARKDGHLSAKQSKAYRKLVKELEKLDGESSGLWQHRSIEYSLDQLQRCLDVAAGRAIKPCADVPCTQRLNELSSFIEDQSKRGEGNAEKYASYKQQLAALSAAKGYTGSKSVISSIPTDAEIDELEQAVYLSASPMNDSYTQVRCGLLDNRLYQIRELMDNGVKIGALTKSETEYLDKEFYFFQKLKDRWVSDSGHLQKWRYDILRNMAVQLRAMTEICMEKPATGQVDSGIASDTPQFVWTASRRGGYYDITGRINGLFPLNELSKYGGTLEDGRPVKQSRG